MGFKSEGRNIVGATILLVKAKPFEKWSCSQIKYQVIVGYVEVAIVVDPCCSMAGAFSG